MKKLFSILLAAAFFASYSPNAFAANLQVDVDSIWADTNDLAAAVTNDTIEFITGPSTATVVNNQSADDGGGFDVFGIGAITDTGVAVGTVDVTTHTSVVDVPTMTVTIASADIAGNFTVRNVDLGDATNITTVSGALTVGGALNVTNTEVQLDEDVSLTVGGALAVTGATTITGGTLVGADATLTANGATVASTGGFLLDDGAAGLAILAIGGPSAVTGTIDGAAAGEGTLTINSGISSFADAIGGVADLADINVGGDAAAIVTFADNVSAMNMDIQNASTVNFDRDFAGTAIDFESNGIINLAAASDVAASITNTSGAAAGTLNLAGSSNITGTVGAAGVAALSAINVNGIAGTTVLFGNDAADDVFATTLTVGAGDASFTASYTGEIDFSAAAGATGEVILADGETITGNIDAADPGEGTLTFSGGGLMTGDIGDAGAGNQLALVTVNAGAVTTTGTVAATTVNFAGAGSLTIAAAQILEAAVTTAAPNTGTLTFTNGATMTGTIGTTANRLDLLNVDGAGTVAASGDIFTEDLNFGANGVLTAAGGANLTSTNAITNTTDGQGTITFLGTTSTGADMGVAGTDDLLAVNFNGGTATLNNNIAAITTTVNADTDLALSGDRTITGNLTLAGTSDLELADNTLTLAGTGIYTQGAGTSLNLGINSAADFGSVQATGNSAIAAGSLLDVDVNAFIASGTTFNVVNGAAAGAVGAVTVTDNSSVLSFTGAGVAGDLVLTATRTNSYTNVATSPNGASVGAALEAIGAAGPSGDMLNVLSQLDSLSSAQIAAALEQLDPVIDGGILEANYAINAQFMHTLTAHMNALHSGYLFSQTGQTGVASGDTVTGENWWGQGFGTTIEQDARDGINGYEADVYGTAIGADGLINERTHLGWAAGYANGDVDSKGDSGHTDIDSYQGALYGTYSDGPGYINAAFMFAWNDYDGTRDISFPGINRTATSDYSGQQYNGLIDGGYTFKGGPLDITPVASLNYTHLTIEDYEEEGAGSLNLKVSDQDYDVLQSGLGLKLALPLRWDAGTLVPEVHAKWLYDFIGDKMQTTSTFTGGGPSFTTNGVDPDQHSLNAGGSITFYSKGSVSISANYDLEVKDEYTGHSGFGTVKVHF